MRNYLAHTQSSVIGKAVLTNKRHYFSRLVTLCHLDLFSLILGLCETYQDLTPQPMENTQDLVNISFLFNLCVLKLCSLV